MKWFQVSEVYSKELKGAISALASLQGHLLIASGPKIILHKWTGSELNGVAFCDVPPLHVVSLNIVSTICSVFPFTSEEHYQTKLQLRFSNWVLYSVHFLLSSREVMLLMVIISRVVSSTL